MNGYIEAGYSVVIGTLAIYSATLVQRERAARRRLAGSAPRAASQANEQGEQSHNEAESERPSP